MIKESVTMTAVGGHTRSAKSPRHSNMEDGRALRASVLTAADHLTACTPTTQSVLMSRLNVIDATMFVPRGRESMKNVINLNLE